jgi:hypothetical protein
MIDVSGLNPAALLAALFNNSKPLGLGVFHDNGDEMTEDEAAQAIAERRNEDGLAYFDYLRGRVMKVEIGGESLDPRLYDRDLGNGAAARVVARLRGALAL